jgi:hypothetical protein
VGVKRTWLRNDSQTSVRTYAKPKSNILSRPRTSKAIFSGFKSLYSTLKCRIGTCQKMRLLQRDLREIES